MKQQVLTVGLILVLIGIPAISQAMPQKVIGPVVSLFPSRDHGLNALPNVQGTFWRNPEWAKTFGLTADQEKKMEEVFQQYRLKLIDIKASLDKEELILQPLIGPVRPTPQDEAKIMTQFDRIADARAELEKTNSKMLLSLLQVLTEEQWKMLQTESKKKQFFRHYAPFAPKE